MNPTKQTIKALAGWALTRSDEESMRNLRDACEGIVEFVDDEPEDSRALIVSEPLQGEVVIPPLPVKKPKPPVIEARRPMVPGMTPDQIHTEARQMLATYFASIGKDQPQADPATCSHVFNMDTTRCLKCKQTYEAIHGKKPEFIGQPW